MVASSTRPDSKRVPATRTGERTEPLTPCAWMAETDRALGANGTLRSARRRSVLDALVVRARLAHAAGCAGRHGAATVVDRSTARSLRIAGLGLAAAMIGHAGAAARLRKEA